jgi:hypothetical protein
MSGSVPQVLNIGTEKVGDVVDGVHKNNGLSGCSTLAVSQPVSQVDGATEGLPDGSVEVLADRGLPSRVAPVPVGHWARLRDKRGISAGVGH